MKVPDPERWRVVRSALTSWSRTARLCLILLIIGISVDTTALLAVWAHNLR
jgi:hypothetical protein